MSIVRKRKKGRMVKSMKRGVVLGLSSLLAVTGASATPPGAIEVKGILEARSAESITVAGVTCTANALTKIEGDPQVGQQAELKLLDGICLELEREGAEDGSSQSKEKSQRSSAKLSAVSTPAPGSKNKEGGKVAVKRKGGKIRVEISGKVLAAENSVVTANLGSAGCPVSVKGKKKGHDHSSNSTSSPSRLRTIKFEANTGGTSNKVKPSGCASIPDYSAGGEVTIVVDGAVRLQGTLAALPTATPTPPPAP